MPRFPEVDAGTGKHLRASRRRRAGPYSPGVSCWLVPLPLEEHDHCHLLQVQETERGLLDSVRVGATEGPDREVHQRHVALPGREVAEGVAEAGPKGMVKPALDGPGSRWPADAYRRPRHQGPRSSSPSASR